MVNDISLMRMVIEDLAKNHGWTHEKAMSEFYNSGTCRALSNKETGVFAYAPWEIIEMFEEDFEYPPVHQT